MFQGSQSYDLPKDRDGYASLVTPTFTTLAGTIGGTNTLTFTFGSAAVGGFLIHDQSEATAFDLRLNSTTGSVPFKIQPGLKYIPSSPSAVTVLTPASGTITIEAMYFSL
jgi:hypothetical protein